jgi:hypothetical protein
MSAGVLLLLLLKGFMPCRAPRGLPGQDAVTMATAALRRDTMSTTLSLRARAWAAWCRWNKRNVLRNFTLGQLYHPPMPAYL